MIQPRNIAYLICWTALLILQSCKSPSPAPTEDAAFETLDQNATGLDFSNSLHPTPAFSVFDYMYYYNGGGIGAGDFNNDGLIDLFFASNQENNKLYLNTGKLHFRDITAASHIPQDHGWSTGVSIVDINNDGLLDIYICKVGRLEGLPPSHNQLLVCQGIDSNGIPTYRDQAAEYGLDFSGFSTQAVFFDYDGDGDLDMYLLNHTIHQNGTYGPRQQKLAIFNPLAGDRLFRNDGPKGFKECTKEGGIHGSVLGYGLGTAAADIDLDGWPDIYTANDFQENDYLYINDHHGHFSDQLDQRIMHTSRFSMGVEIADINNDAFPEIISMDMLPYDPYMLKRSQGEDSWDNFNLKLSFGYNYQYTRNNLQFNRGNGHFTETAFYSGIAATDWSWAPLLLDFDNDGYKDLFISNGIPRRLNDIDYINFISDQELQQNLSKGVTDKDIEMVNKFPRIKLPGKFFRNEGQLKFSDQEKRIAGARPCFSNGAIYADLDNDGDLDIVVNNIDDPALVYRNTSNDSNNRPFVSISLNGPAKNSHALGAKLVLYTDGQIRTYEKFPVRGFLSSMEIPLHIGLFKTKIDSAFLIWPDNTFQPISLSPHNPRMSLTWQKGLPHFDYSRLHPHMQNASFTVKDITTATGLLYKHEENNFPEFDREALLPHMLSTEGPALTVGDINGDGLDDAFIGSSKWKKSAVFIQQKTGRFIRFPEPALEMDSSYEDVDACLADIDRDGNMDLIVASGGNEFYGLDTMLTPRVYLGDGKGHFRKLLHAFDSIFVNASTVTSSDIDGDGYPDLFIGGRSVPGSYGAIPQSYLLHNDGHGKFKDVTDQYAPGLSRIGFVTSAKWTDLDKDGRPDLLLSLEWGGIYACMRRQNQFTLQRLFDGKGWWNFVLPVDIDKDGDIDLIAGNLGLNNRLTASGKEPVRLYYNDFDNNRKKEQILTYYLKGREITFASKEELEKQIPILRKNFLYAKDFAAADIDELFSKENLTGADTLSADYFGNIILINDGHLKFTAQPMPWEAQLSVYRDAAVVDANGDDLPDILLFGNYYENNIQMGRIDGDYGTLLLNKGHHNFSAGPLNGLAVQGQVRHIRSINILGKQAFLLARNNDSARIIQFKP